jgi:hypothetical protein
MNSSAQNWIRLGSLGQPSEPRDPEQAECRLAQQQPEQDEPGGDEDESE